MIAATLSRSSSLRAFSANVGQSLAPSSTIVSILLPITPPLALISSIASFSASTTEASAMAMVPVSECRMPIFTDPCAHAPRGQMNGPVDAVTTAAAVVPLRNPRLLSIIPILLSAARRKQNGPQAGATLRLAGHHARVRGDVPHEPDVRCRGRVSLQEEDRSPPPAAA